MASRPKEDGISRRDFFNGLLIAAGTAAVGASFPMRVFAQGTTFPCDGPIGSDPRVLRGGNLPSVFNVAHWLRDDRLTFGTNSVRISPSPSMRSSSWEAGCPDARPRSTSRDSGRERGF